MLVAARVFLGHRVNLQEKYDCPELAARYHQALEKVLRQPAVKEQFARLGAEVRPGSSAEYAEFIRSEIARTARIVRDAKITLD